jgi:SH3 domain-containing YSC84-like protein 1
MKIILRNLSLAVLTALMLFGLIIFTTAPAVADDKADAQQLVEKAKLAFQNFLTDPSMGVMRDLMKNARGVFITPQLLRGAYVIGASGGSGVFLAKEGDKWKGPAFYTVGGASIGLQIGGESSEVVLLVMTERGVTAFLADNLKLGADADVAAGPVGLGIAAQTANLSGDILSFSRSKGLYGGVSLHGSVVAARDSLNSAYYGQKIISPADILVRSKLTNPQAAGLIEEVAKSAKK